MDLQNTTAHDLAEGIRTRTLRATDLMAATYDQIEAWNPHVNALVSLLPREAAMDLARDAEKDASSGPLHGLPIAIKDLANAAGFVTTQGSPALAAGAPAEQDDVMVARLRAAGAIIIGKSNTPAFGMGSHTSNPVFGTTRNPWNLTRTAGGSSGGGSVGLATGMLPLADGSDMMGSLRNPAGWANIYGLRPSFGAVPPEPGGEMFNSQLSTLGPMARSPSDIALMMSVIAGPDRRFPHGQPLPPAGPDRKRRIGWLRDFNGAVPFELGIMDLCEQALSVFTDLGHEVVPIDLGFSQDALWASWTTLRAVQMAGSLGPIADAFGTDALGANAAFELKQGRRISAMEVHAASVTRSDWFVQASALFESVDVLALPSAQCWPFDSEISYPIEIAGVAMDTYHRWMQAMVPASLIGLPALCVPAGFAPKGPFEGLPMGMQLIGPRSSDYDLLALGQGFHMAAPWTDLRPSLPTSI